MADDLKPEERRPMVAEAADPTAFARLGESLRHAGRYQEAIAACREGLALHPEVLAARMTLASALIAVNQPDQARAEFAMVHRLARENFEVIRRLARPSPSPLQSGTMGQSSLDVSAQPAPPAQDKTERLIGVLERWLENILSERERRRHHFS